MIERAKHFLPATVATLIAALFLNMQINKRSSVTDTCFSISGDARGYYAWLPALFIYHDLNFSFFDSVEAGNSCCGSQSGIPLQDYRVRYNGKQINKYYPGSSFMMLPFFAAAHVVARNTPADPANGYSPPYFRIMGFAGIAWYLAGMLFTILALGRLGVKPWQQALTILLLSFGTNVIFYAIDAPLYSHVYSFALVALFIYLALALRESCSERHIISLSFVAGWILVARPVSATVFLMLPFLLMDYPRLTNTLLKPRMWISAIAPGLIMPCILFILYKQETGHVFVYSYGKEHFTFLHPHFFSFLFSYDNGLLAYTPLYALPLGTLLLWKPSDRRLLTGIAATLLLTVYIHSSWWAWWYGYAFGARTMVDMLPLLALTIGVSLKDCPRKKLAYLLAAYFLAALFTAILYQQKSAGGFMHNYPVHDYWTALKAFF